MATTETRLLLLGAVALFEPVNGYQIRRELLSWRVEAWANIQPGSIYNGLATLTQRGDLVRHDLRDGSREVAVYELSDKGRAEFRGSIESALTEVRPTTPLAFQTAIAHAAAGRRGPMRCVLLRQRLANLDAAGRRGTRCSRADPDHAPPARAGDDGLLGARSASVEREWLRSAARRASRTASWPSSVSRWAGPPPTTIPGTR